VIESVRVPHRQFQSVLNGAPEGGVMGHRDVVVVDVDVDVNNMVLVRLMMVRFWMMIDLWMMLDWLRE
jgi:hypothetical protein